MNDSKETNKKAPYEKPKLIRHDELQKTINPYGPRTPKSPDSSDGTATNKN